MSLSRPGTPTSTENIVRHARQPSEGDSSLIGHALTAVSGRDVTAFGRTVTATAATLIGPFGDSISSNSNHYQHAMSDISKELRRPSLQRRVFTFAQRTPTELVRSKLSTAEIQHKALTFLPDDLLRNIPDNENTYSLFQGFQATLSDVTSSNRKRRPSGHRKMLEDSDAESNGASNASVTKLTKERANLARQLEMFSIRKNMSSSEIREIDIKIANLNAMRNIVLERLAKLEQEEAQLEHEILEVDNRIEDIQEELESVHLETENDSDSPTSNAGSEFMSESIYGKLSNNKAPKKRRSKKRLSMPILHEHFDPGTNITEIQTHADSITTLDFDVPFGTLVTAALDDTVRVWDLSSGRCLGMLEGHNASVRCLQVEDNIVATGSMDATIRLWDLSRAEHYRNAPPGSSISKKGYNGDDADDEETDDGQPSTVGTRISSPPGHVSLNECSVFSLDAHVDEITALYFQGDTLVSGSADKTLRQWDLQKGRCVQTLDVLWAAAQTSGSPTSEDSRWRNTSRAPDVKADFVGALQCFDAALACGTADGMVRLWDLRSGQVHRSLVGHTGPITCLQFDDVHLVTGSLDRSIRIWDLRTGSIFDAYGYDNPITSMQFDTRRIVAASGEPVAKIYDKAEGRHWDCGTGARVDDDGGEVREKSIVYRVRVKDGYLVEGRKDGMVGVWSC